MRAEPSDGQKERTGFQDQIQRERAERQLGESPEAFVVIRFQSSREAAEGGAAAPGKEGRGPAPGPGAGCVGLETPHCTGSPAAAFRGTERASACVNTCGTEAVAGRPSRAVLEGGETERGAEAAHAAGVSECGGRGDAGAGALGFT